MRKLIFLILFLSTPAQAVESMTLREYQQFEATLKKIDACLDTSVDQNGVVHIWLRYRYKIGPIIYNLKIDGYDYTPLIGRVFTLADLLPNTNMVEVYDKGCWR